MTSSEDSPEMVAFEALRPFCIPSTASHLSHVVVTALRAAGLLKGCGGSCGPVHAEGGKELEERLCGKAAPLSSREWALLEAAEVALKPIEEAESTLEQAMRDAADEGEWPEVGA